MANTLIHATEMVESQTSVDRHIARRAAEQRKQISLHHLSRLLGAYRIEKGTLDEGCWGSAKDRLRVYLADRGLELLFDEDGPVPGLPPARRVM